MKLIIGFWYCSLFILSLSIKIAPKPLDKYREKKCEAQRLYLLILEH